MRIGVDVVGQSKIDELIKRAHEGDIDAQYQVGEYFMEDWDYEQAFKWFSMAAEQGNADAQYKVGFLLSDNSMVEQANIQDSISWLRKAEKGGHAKAVYRLGVYISLGEGFNRSYTEAFRYYLRAAEMGDPEAQYKVGMIYLRPKLNAEFIDKFGVEKNRDNAFKWLMKAYQGRDLSVSREADQLMQSEGLVSRRIF